MSIVSVPTKALLQGLTADVSAALHVAYVEEEANAGLYTWDTETASWIMHPARLLSANPTASAGDVAVAGTANTFMRSDAAPAIQKATAEQFGLVKLGSGLTVGEDGSTSVSNSSGGTASAVNGHADGQYPAAGMVGEVIRGIAAAGSINMPAFAMNSYLVGQLTLTPGNWAVQVAAQFSPVSNTATAEAYDSLYYWGAWLELRPSVNLDSSLYWFGYYSSPAYSVSVLTGSPPGQGVIVSPVFHYSITRNKTLTLKANIDCGTNITVAYDKNSLVAVRES